MLDKKYNHLEVEEGKYNIWKENHKGMTVKYTPNDKSYLAIGISSIQRDMIDSLKFDLTMYT